jgi:phosphoenolpyruvate---glycerone phosphotransferase subunit DhaL
VPGLTTPILREALRRIAQELEQSADELNALDAVLGDGDIGVSLVRGGRSLMAELPNLPNEDLGKALAHCAQAITKISGSTCGTLFATGLLSAAKICKGRSEVPWNEMPRLLSGAIDDMASRGKCELGDKTVLDAIEAARCSIQSIGDPATMIESADKAVSIAIDRFRGQVSRQGRARMFPDRSVGSADPGMVAFKHIIQALK